jgi:protein involved in polysaccharide export with SLBB domain
MNRMQAITIAIFSLVLSICATGCNNKFFDPTQIGRFRPTPAVNVILDSLGVAGETPIGWEKAGEPKPSDIVAVPTDYVLRSGDVVRISIFELYQEGVPFENDYVITETGKISIPDVGVVQATSLSETQLEDEIQRILSPEVLKEPSISATLVNSQQRTFSILGEGVLAPNRYVIPRYDFRLADALASAGGVKQFNVSYIYVSRSIEEQKETSGPAEIETQRREQKLPELEVIGPGGPEPKIPEQRIPELRILEPEVKEPQLKLERQMLRMITPSAQNPQFNQSWPQSKKITLGSTRVANERKHAKKGLSQRFGYSVDSRSNTKNTPHIIGSSPALSSRRMLTNELEGENRESGRIEWVFRSGKWIPIQIGPPEAMKPTLALKEEKISERIDWMFKDGGWVPISPKPQRPKEPAVKFEPEKPAPLEQKLPEELEWEAALQTRVIKIPVAKLLAGDPRYNIVIKPGDAIHVPVDIIGEFAIMGNVNGTGYINITGRPMTLKMAIAAAGGLGPLACPKRCEVIRRIGDNREEIVMVDLDKIASGEQPDFFIKPNDLINVGTSATSRWRAILRNAFRATYGFGFVYDRNFADADYGKGFRRPHWL